MKRWYQLSLLQMLAVTAVLALFIYKNISASVVDPNRRSDPLSIELVPFGYSVDLGPTPLYLDTVQSGWPIPYWHAYGTVSAGQVLLAADPKVRAWALVADVALCASSIVAVTLSLSSFKRKFGTCKSPSR